MTNPYLLIDMDTGAMDGWYFDADTARDVLVHRQEITGTWIMMRLEQPATCPRINSDLFAKARAQLLLGAAQTNHIPEIQAERIDQDGAAQLRFYCDHCQRHHYHSAGDRPGDGDGYRVAHCHDPESPYAESGYRLREVRS